MTLAWMEETASELSEQFLKDDEITVGAHVTLDHLAPAWAGEVVNVTAKLKERNGRKLSFHIEAHRGNTLLARADHVRVIVKKKEFKK